MFESLVASFTANPWATVLGSGGILGVVALIVRWWRTLPTLRVRRFKETFDTANPPNVDVVIEVELENLGREPTSLLPEVSMQCLSAKRKPMSATFRIDQPNRTLQPVTPTTITLSARVSANYVFSHFRILRIRASRGGSVSLRVLNASGVVVHPFKFYFLRNAYILTGHVPRIGA
jgi:hypothetical protein